MHGQSPLAPGRLEPVAGRVDELCLGESQNVEPRRGVPAHRVSSSLPDHSDQVELARDPPAGAAEPLGDLVAGVSLELPESDRLQQPVSVVQAVDQSLELLGGLPREVRRKPRSDDVFIERLARPSRPPLLPRRLLDLIDWPCVR